MLKKVICKHEEVTHVVICMTKQSRATKLTKLKSKLEKKITDL